MRGGGDRGYYQRQYSPLCLLLYATGVAFLVIGFAGPHPLRWVFVPTSAVILVVATSFHHLTVADEGDRLSIRFGPLPLFRRSLLYDDIVAVEAGRTTLLDGLGIHYSLRGGWVWNIWGRACVVIKLRQGTLYLGTDDGPALIQFLQSVTRHQSDPEAVEDH